VLQRLPVGSGQLVRVLLHQLLQLEALLIGSVARVGQLVFPLVLLRMDFGVLPHARDVRLAQSCRILDAHRGLFGGRLVFGAHVEDGVLVDVERDFDLRQAARCGHEPFQVELTQQAVVSRHGPFALEHAHGNRRLVIFGRTEDLLLLDRDRRVAFDEFREHAPLRLDPQ